MDFDQLGPEAEGWVREALGYLNFSSGAADPKFLRAINSLFGRLTESGEWRVESGESRVESGERRLSTLSSQLSTPPAWRRLRGVLESGLARLGGRSDAFRDVDQAGAVLRLVFDVVLPGYRRHHGDLLFHQTDERLFQPFFIGRVCEAVLAEGGPWDQDGADPAKGPSCG